VGGATHWPEVLQVCALVSTVPLHDAGAHWLFDVQPVHIPETHASVPPVPHGVPSVTGWCDVFPLVLHVSVVQALPSSAKSEASKTVVVPPLPSHTTFWQSPAVCMLVGVMAAVYAAPHA
jgi:hypothetical protein